MTPKPLETRLLIRILRPERWILAFGLVLFLVLTAVWGSYEYGRKVAGFHVSANAELVSGLQERLQLAEAEIAETQQRAAMLERNSQIEGDASADLKETLAKVQGESLKLKKELSFYKSIVSPEQTKRSVAIQTIQLDADGNGGYKYRIMVSQRGRNDRFVRGVVDVSLIGSQDGEALVIPLKNVSDRAKKPIKFGFKYFQNIEGKMKLPAAFRPETMRVQVKPTLKSIDKIDEQFAWTDLTAGGTQNVGQKQN